MKLTTHYIAVINLLWKHFLSLRAEDRIRRKILVCDCHSKKKRISIKLFNHIHYQIAKQDITADVCYVAHGTQNI